MGDLYRIELKPTSQIKLPFRAETKLAIFRPIFDKERNYAGKPELETKVFTPAFIHVIKRAGFAEVDKGEIFESEDGYGYLQAMIYGAVMSVLKTRADWGILEDIVFSLEPISLRFWASKLKNVFWKYKSQKEIRFLAKRIWEIENL